MRIVLIVSDTFRYDHLGCNGNERIRTPELDAFARDAVVFDNYYVSSFPTLPHRCDMNTGRWSFPFHGWQPLEPDEIPIAEHLLRAGYHTQLLCDCPHLVGGDSNFHRGFESYYWNRGQEGDVHMMRLNAPPTRFLPRQKARQADLMGFEVSLLDVHRWTNRERTWEGDTFAATTASLACKWLEQNYKCDRFFLWVDFFDPHEPWDPPEHFVELYDPGYTCQPMMHPNYGHASAYTPEELRNLRAHYAGEVTLVSKWIGTVLRKLQDTGIYDDTLVVFTSDHGTYLGEHDRTGKSNINEDDHRGPWPLYREITHIPLMAKPPRCRGGMRRSEIVQPPDICPTILEAAGVQPPAGMPGRSLWPLLEGGSEWDRSHAMSSAGIADSPQATSPLTVTDARWSVVLWPNRGPELFDLEADPAEERNVAEEHPEKVAELRGAMLELLRLDGAPANRIEVARALSAG